MSDWPRVPSDAPDLFDRLAALGEAEVVVRFGIGVEGGYRVDVPATRLALRGRLRLFPGRDRFGIEQTEGGASDFAWFARRKGRGRTDYWQGAIERHSDGVPALTLYLTAPLDGLEIRPRPLPDGG
jgi:hypothetical protein